MRLFIIKGMWSDIIKDVYDIEAVHVHLVKSVQLQPERKPLVIRFL